MPNVIDATMNPFSILTSGVFGALNRNTVLNKTRLAGAMMRYEAQQIVSANIQTLIGTRQELEDRITSILSDYTQMINQVSIVSTLTLGMGLGAFGSLLGNVEDQPEWKLVLFTCSCVLTICFSVLSVIESFFLAIHINQVEARFVGGVYPHISKDSERRTFQLSELEDLNSKFNFIVVTFFISFLIFSTTLLGTIYIGLGLSNSVFGDDSRLVDVSGHKFVNDTRWPVGATEVPLSLFEPSYVSAAQLLTYMVIATYSLIMYRFLSSYIQQIHGKQLLRFLLLCSCIDPTDKSSHNIKSPMKAAATRFNDLQRDISSLTEKWFISSAQCIVDILMFQRQLNDKVTKQLQNDLIRFREIVDRYNPTVMLSNQDVSWSKEIRQRIQKQYEENPDRQAKNIKDIVWNEFNCRKNHWLATWDVSILTLSHGCRHVTKAIQRAAQQWNTTDNETTNFLINETTKLVMHSMNARINVMKQHVIAENTIKVPELSYTLPLSKKAMTFLFVWIYLIFGTIGSLIAFAFGVLILLLFPITTCGGRTRCFCCIFWKRTNRTGYFLAGLTMLPIDFVNGLSRFIMGPIRCLQRCHDKCMEDQPNVEQGRRGPVELTRGSIELVENPGPITRSAYKYSKIIEF